MKFVIFSGTTEGRELSRLLAEAGAQVTVCVATEYGSEEQGSVPGVETRQGPLSPEEKAVLLSDAALCIDATHPYARNILLTTGAKELPAYAELPPERLFPRVLPSLDSIAACEALGIPHRNIIAMQGPFSREMNAATIRQYEIRILVSKDGGGPGGFAEKAAAARETGAELIVIRRPEENGLSFDEVLKQCITMLSH